MPDGAGKINNEEKSVEREAGVQGSRWNTVHDGYFGDPAVAQPMVDAICRAMKDCSPTVLADLGGGTGLILHRVLAQAPCNGVRMEDVDISLRQLSQDRDPHIMDLAYSVADVTRANLCPREDDRLMFTLRSLLHYFGHEGSRTLLRHLREQMNPGEAFVHQSACFEDPRGAECLDRIYAMMKSDKWYTTVDEMTVILQEEGWTATKIETAPPIHLTSADLADRYHLSDADVAAIRDDVTSRFGALPGVFDHMEDGFSSWLHYRIFTCVAE
ncbi:MAG: hypothetical protein GXP25_07390 [Planctomycetes bacterium]|nr:hypothetical protein [Planctomycetota bacterium]